jgi:hypothetical protein
MRERAVVAAKPGTRAAQARAAVLVRALGVGVGALVRASEVGSEAASGVANVAAGGGSPEAGAPLSGSGRAVRAEPAPAARVAGTQDEAKAA